MPPSPSPIELAVESVVVGPLTADEGADEREPALEGERSFHAATIFRTLLRGVRGRSVSEDAVGNVLRDIDREDAPTDCERAVESPSVCERECP